MFLNCRLGTAARVTMLVALSAVGVACSSSSGANSDAGSNDAHGSNPDAQPQGDVQVSPDVATVDTPSAIDVVQVATDGAEADNGDVQVAPGHCRNNNDCVGNELGLFVCDTSSGVCRSCSPSPDSCAASQHCDPVMYICTAGCHDDSGCMDSSGHDGGTSATNHCDPTMHICVGCINDGQCPTGEICVGNMCTMGCNATQPCPTGQTCCNSACAQLSSSTANCGACGNACTISNGMASCSAGSCAVGTCAPGFADCDHTESNGCETNTNTSAANCGSCGNACPTVANSTPTCAMGACGFTCNAGFADCDGVASNGCEVNLQSDPTHCGSCTSLCNPPEATPGCSMGMCTVASCAPGFANCDGNPTNGCEVNVTDDSQNCGTCGNACPTAANAFPGCVGSSCVISCVAGFADCTGVAGAGCTTNTVTDPTNCGACHASCVIPHGVAGCTGSMCTVASCNPGFADCDLNPANGCEVNTNSDTMNCGTCGNICTTAGGTPVCSAGTCGIGTCAAGFAHCAASGTACETNTTDDPNNCGGCGDICSLPHATAVCTASACAIGACNPGYADCNHVASDGCEVNINTDLNNCGACAAVCAPAHAAAGVCTSGACGIAACTPGFADCNMNPADGCEINIGTSAANCGGCGQACPSGAACQGSVCTFYPSTGAEGAYAPTANGTLAAGLHNFTTITIPAGVTIRPTGTGVLDLRATGDVNILGTLDASGGAGGAVAADCNCGNGGSTGTGIAGGESGVSNSTPPASCPGGAGGGTVSGGDASGANGVIVSGYPAVEGLGGAGGGGGGGYFGGGGGGGGYSGGVGGYANQGFNGGAGAGTEAGGGGSALGPAAPTGGTLSAACYAASGGSAGTNRDNTGSAGGGGSIGAVASNDPSVASTFRTGSGGGGGGAGGGDDGTAGCGDGETGGGGGGGGGGAVRLATTTHIVVSGSVLANGGAGGASAPSGDDCEDDSGQSGGGGSGGVLFLYSPAITVSGHVSAVGAVGGTVTYGTCGVVGTSTGGSGGLGRIRFSVDNVTPGACALGGAINPPVAGTTCAANSAPCQAYVAQYPN